MSTSFIQGVRTGAGKAAAGSEIRRRQGVAVSAYYVDKRARDAAAAVALREHRARVEGGVTIRTYSVPCHGARIRVTGCCPYCAGSGFEIEWPIAVVDRPHVAYRAAVLCLLCGRTVATLVVGGQS